MVVRKIFCSFFFLPGRRHLVIGEEVTPHQLPTTIITRFCGHTEFLRALCHRKGRVQNLNLFSVVCHTNILIPESQVALVETSKNTTENRFRFCTHPTCRNTYFVPKPRLW
jgi:hypothetical protein